MLALKSSCVQGRLKMKKLADIYQCLGQAFKEHAMYKNEGTGKTLNDNILRAYSDDAVPLGTALLMIEQLSQDYPPAKDLWLAMKKVQERSPLNFGD